MTPTTPAPLTFPIMLESGQLSGRRGIPWALIADQEAQAKENHDQTLRRLAERGGLSATEAVAVLEGRRWLPMKATEAVQRLDELVERWERRNALKEIADLQAQLTAATEREAEAKRQYGLSVEILENALAAVKAERDGNYERAVRAKAKRDEAKSEIRIGLANETALREELDAAQRDLSAAQELLRRWIAHGFPMGAAPLWDDTKAFLGTSPAPAPSAEPSADGQRICVCTHAKSRHARRGGVLACTVPECACGPGCIHEGFVCADGSTLPDELPAPTPAVDVEAIRRRCDAATPGPWKGEGALVEAVYKCPGTASCPFEDCEGEPEHEYVVAECNQDYERENDNDCEFIAAARTDVPLLLAEIARLRSAPPAEELTAEDDREDPREVGYPPVLCDYCKGGRHEGIACQAMIDMAHSLLSMPRGADVAAATAEEGLTAEQWGRLDAVVSRIASFGGYTPLIDAWAKELQPSIRALASKAPR